MRSQSQVNCIIVHLKTSLAREGQPARGALERLLLEVDCAPVSLHVCLLGEGLAAVATYELLSKVQCPVVAHHVAPLGEDSATGCDRTRNAPSCKTPFVDISWLAPLLATPQ